MRKYSIFTHYFLGRRSYGSKNRKSGQTSYPHFYFFYCLIFGLFEPLFSRNIKKSPRNGLFYSKYLQKWLIYWLILISFFLKLIKNSLNVTHPLVCRSLTTCCSAISTAFPGLNHLRRCVLALLLNQGFDAL